MYNIYFIKAHSFLFVLKNTNRYNIMHNSLNFNVQYTDNIIKGTIKIISGIYPVFMFISREPSPAPSNHQVLKEMRILKVIFYSPFFIAQIRFSK